MSVCWTVFLPLIIAYVVLLPCVVYGLDALPTQIVL
jgi:NADH-ubiquinone oxidoreductase chain 1